MAPIHGAGGYQGPACLPLRVEDQHLGAAVLSFEAPRAFGPDGREYLLAVATLCAQALDLARLYEHQPAIARTLQAALLPSQMPVLPGLRLAAS